MWTFFVRRMAPPVSTALIFFCSSTTPDSRTFSCLLETTTIGSKLASEFLVYPALQIKSSFESPGHARNPSYSPPRFFQRRELRHCSHGLVLNISASPFLFLCPHGSSPSFTNELSNPCIPRRCRCLLLPGFHVQPIAVMGLSRTGSHNPAQQPLPPPAL